MPLAAATWAMPLPMTPAPITPSVLIDIDITPIRIMSSAETITSRSEACMIRSDRPRRLIYINVHGCVLQPNFAISRQTGREQNEGCKVIYSTNCEADHNQKASPIIVHTLTSMPTTINAFWAKSSIARKAKTLIHSSLGLL